MKPHRPYEDLLSTNPVLRLVVPLMAGIIAGEWGYNCFSGLGLTFIVAATSCIALMFFLRRNATAVSVILTLGMAFIGCELAVSTRDSLHTAWPERPQTCRITVLDSPKSTAKTLQLTGSINGGIFSGKKVRLSLIKKDDTPDLLPGDALIFHSRIVTPKASGNPGDFDRGTWLRRQGVAGEAFCFAKNWERSEISPSHLPLTVLALRLRASLIARYAKEFKGRDLGILSAMTLGDRRGIDEETRRLFSETGVSHVLALSGLHLSILFSIYNLLVMKRLRIRWLKTVMSLVGVAGIWAFAFMAGLPLSLLRAAGMFSCMQLLMCLHRRTVSVNNLALSALLILLFSPMSLFDVGFQLSCLSVLAILLFVNRIPVPRFIIRYRLLRWCWGLLSVSFVAQIATAPLVAFYFNQLPTYGLLANFLAVPLAYGILFLSFFFLAIPPLQSIIAMPLGWMLSIMDGGLSWVSSLPFSVVRLYPTEFATVISYIFIISLSAYAVSRRATWLYLSSLFLIAGTSIEFLLDRRNEAKDMIVFYNLRSTPAIHFIDSPEKSYLWMPDTVQAERTMAYVRRTFWNKKGITQPTLLSANEANADIFCTGRATLFNKRKVVLLTENLPYRTSQSNGNRLDVDYLVIARDFKQGLSRVLKTYSPKTLILDSSLSDYYREKFRKEASEVGIAFHDMAESGALVVRI